MQPTLLIPLALSLAATTTAQQAVEKPTAAPQPSTQVTALPGAMAGWQGVVHDAPGDGNLYAATPTWKAVFGPASVQFVPFLGSDEPQNHPLGLARADVQIAGEALATQDAAPVRSGDEIVYDRGAFAELYRTDMAGIEQRFRFDHLPARGELAFTIPVATDLEPATAADGLVFRHPRALVRYSQAIAIDAKGHRLPLATTYADGAIHFAVPAAFVAEAALPLWIDPIVGSTYVGTTQNYQILTSDIAVDASAGEHQAVWEFQFSQGDHDIYVQRLDGTMTPLGSPIAIDSTTVYWSSPSIANHALSDRFLTAATRISGGAYAVAARITVAGQATAASSQFEIEGPAAAGNLGLDASGPSVGGDPSAVGPTYWAVAFTVGTGQQTDVYCRLVGSTGTLIGTAPTPIATSTRPESGVRISKSNGAGPFATQAWAITYFFYSLSGTQVHARTISWNGTPIGPGHQVANGVTSFTNFAVSSPTDDQSGQRRFLVTYEDAGSGNGDIVGQLIDRASAVINVSLNLSMLALAPQVQTKPQMQPAVDCDGRRFLVGWTHEFSATDPDIHLATFMPSHNLTSLDFHGLDLVAGSNTEERGVHVAAWHSGGGGALRYAALWTNTFGTQSRLEGTLYDGRQDGAFFATRITGCGGLGIASSGSPLPGETFGMALSGVQGLGGFIAGVPTNVPVLGCAGCVQGVSGFNLIGNQMTVTVPVAASYVGLTLAFQGFDVGQGPCFALARFSDTIDVTIR